MTAPPCPSCGDPRTEVFCALRQLPVHGTAVFETAEQARALRRADQVLAVCSACAFVFNSAFDPSLLDYSSAHEESQAASTTFRAFAGDLAAGWVQRYRLEGQVVLEVGCGKGDFLGLLAQAGVARAHGVDPGLDPARLPQHPAVTGEAAWFGPSEVAREAAAVVCRHTLEHVPDITGFLDGVLTAVDPARCRALLFEVPDVGRVLAEAAFWDLSYEHCSHFTATSLRALFVRHGVDVLDVRRVYGGQYLVLEAAPAGSSGPAPSSEDAAAPVEPVERVVERCRAFARAVEEQLAHWDAWFAARAAADEQVVVWGGGSKGLVFLSALPETGVRRVVDINPGLQGRWMGGAAVPIVAPQALVDDPPAVVLLMNGIYRDEVRRTLDDLGLSDVALMAL